MTKNLLNKILKGILTGATLFEGVSESFAPPSSDRAISEYLKEEARKEMRENVFRHRASMQNAKGIKIPYYRLKPGSCAKYLRLSAKDLFNKEYAAGHAWDLKYDNRIIYEFKENEVSNDSTTYETLKNLIIDWKLEPGMGILAKRDMKPGEYKKYYTNKKKPGKDKMGNKIEESHVIEYLGLIDISELKDATEEEKRLGGLEPIFLHHWKTSREFIRIKDFKDKKNLKLTKIIDEPSKNTPINTLVSNPYEGPFPFYLTRK
jgi:hypothetical protein